jgi:23S rRNA pseudouridine1911/1915/1917 synthase
VVAAPGGARLDRTVADGLGVTVARARAAIDADLVRVDGRRARKGDRVPAGATVAVVLPAEPDAPLPEPERPLEVVHEDPWLLAMNKPAGWLCHPLEAGERGTLANAVVARFPECAAASLDPREGGLCQRLDRETSGLILVARHREAWLAVRALLQAGTVEKIYLALVRGETPDAGRCDLPLSQRGTAPPRALPEPDSKAKSVRPARTRFVTLSRSASFSLLEVWIESGVRYQIRAHLAALGFPLLGDPIYGGGEAPGSLGRHLLHAWKLGLEHPGTGAKLKLLAAPPPDAVRCLTQLGLPLRA